jgi:hypothetical protein
MMPLDTTTAFQNSALHVEQALSEAQFAKAFKLIERLPRRSVRIAWDDTKVPAAYRPTYLAAAQTAIQAWRSPTNLEFKLVGKSDPADMTISFEPKLNPADNVKAPPGVVTFSNELGPGPVLEAVIGLKRSVSLTPTSDVDVASDVAYAIGVYYGLGPDPELDSFMHHSDDHVLKFVHGNALDFGAAERDVDFVDQLSKWAATSQRVQPGLAKAVFDPLKIAPAAAVLQGVPYDFSVQVTNTGNAPLATALKPDCNCFSTTSPKVIAPGETALYQVRMSTILYGGGTVKKHLYLLTGDPDRPMTDIPVSVPVTARVQFIRPDSYAVVLDHSGTEIDVYMAINGKDINPTSAKVEGVDASVTFEPWKGVMADPMINEKAKPRKGYKFKINIGNVHLAGLEIIDLAVDTEDPEFRPVKYIMYIQDGIVAQPNPVYLGHLAPIQRTFAKAIDVSLGHKPFHILGLKCDNPHLKVTQSAIHPYERAINITYDGHALIGDIAATVTIVTDYPDQKLVKVQVSATAD